MKLGAKIKSKWASVFKFKNPMEMSDHQRALVVIYTVTLYLYQVYLVQSTKKGDINTNGVEFFYMDEGANSWQYKMADIRTAKDNPLYETLQPVYSKVGI